MNQSRIRYEESNHVPITFQSRFGPDHVSRRTTIQSKLMMFCCRQRHVWMGSHSMQTHEPLLTAARCVYGWQDIQSKLMNFSSLQRDVWTNGKANAVKSAKSSFSQVKKNTSWSLIATSHPANGPDDKSNFVPTPTTAILGLN